MTELQFIFFLLYMPLLAVPSRAGDAEMYSFAICLLQLGLRTIHLSKASSLHRPLGNSMAWSPLPGTWPAITSPCLELGLTIVSPGPRHLLHLHPLVGPLLISVPCLSPSFLSTNLVTQHNCFKLRHCFILAIKASQPDFALISCLIQHLLSCHGISVSEHLRMGHSTTRDIL